MKNEADARIKIDSLLKESGWRFDDSQEERANIRVEERVELGGYDEKKRDGKADYLLLADNQRPLCVVEAKRESVHPLSAKEQVRNYAKGENCPFAILTNGEQHYFWDIEHDEPQVITQFPTPQSLQKSETWHLNPQELANTEISADYLGDKKQLRDYQVEALHAVQGAAKNGKERYLLEMATGTGKTTVAAALCKLFLNSGQAQRILFLVDRIELENQAEKSLQEIFEGLRFVSTFKKGHWRKADIVVSTVQSLLADNRYRKEFSPTDFHLVISDEAHRSLGGKSRAVFEYFVGYKLGLTATPKDYLKGVNRDTLPARNPKEWERRNLADTYKTFGCEGGEPTYRYNLIRGVREGYLIGPYVLDARTEITTELLADGYALTIPNEDADEPETAIYKARDFEVKFFNPNTNRVFCETILARGLRDPISNEFGKTLVFCVSCNHAAVITDMLNRCARDKFGYTESNFAVQVTSGIPNAQQFAKDFAANNLHGKSHYADETHPDYDTSRTRVCVTVGMMTTGYDCPDLLNIALLRPIFSPSNFIQMKGRGTRTFNFRYQETDETHAKTQYLLLDFFAVYRYFEKEFIYNDTIKLPSLSAGGGKDDTPPASHPLVEDGTLDSIESEELIRIGKEGMRVDRGLAAHEQFEYVIRKSETIRSIVVKEGIDEAVEFIKTHVFSDSNQSWNVMDIRKSYEQAYKIERRISLTEMVQVALKQAKGFKKRQERIDEEFDTFCDIQKLDIDSEQSATLKKFFETYLSDPTFRAIMKSEKYGRLADYPAFRMEDLQRINDVFKGTVKYITEYLQSEFDELNWHGVA